MLIIVQGRGYLLNRATLLIMIMAWVGKPFLWGSVAGPTQARVYSKESEKKWTNEKSVMRKSLFLVSLDQCHCIIPLYGIDRIKI